MLLIYFLFFAESTGRTLGDGTYHYNLTLFKEIKRFWAYRETLGGGAVVLNLLGNIVGFVPFGVFLPILNKRCRSFLYMTLMTFEFSLIVEVVQLVFKVGSFDVDDLLLNTIGGIGGYLVFAIMDKIRRCKYEKAPQSQ